MVKVAFIVEGKVEQIFIDLLHKKGWFRKYNIKKIGPTIDVKGGGNLCPKNMPQFIEQVQTFNPDKIFILTDLECDPCVKKTKKRLGTCDICVIVLAKKAIEAWFLADNKLIENLTNSINTYFEYPENTELMPYETFKQLLINTTGIGTGSKVKFVQKIFQLGFDIERSSTHKNCPSAKYFINKIKGIGNK